MIREVDEDNDGKMSLREFLLIFRKATRGELQAEGLATIVQNVNVSEVRHWEWDALRERHAAKGINERGRVLYG
jgi:hypothetical protein